MAQYNMIIAKLSALQLNKLKSRIKYATDVTLRLSSKGIGGGKTSFLRKLLFTDRQVASFCKGFTNKYHWPTNILIRTLEIIVLIHELESLRMKNWPMNYIDPSTENLKGLKCTHFVEITFGVLILQQICLGFSVERQQWYYNYKRISTRFWIDLAVNQTRYG